LEYLNTHGGATAVGLAYGPSVPDFIAAHPEAIDYVELPFEQLRHTPQLRSLQETIPFVLHCASMSVAGFVPPADSTLDAIAREAERTRTPWIGEHLAFVSADGISEDGGAGVAPTELTYTVCPQMSEETVERVARNLESLRPRFGAPLILENSPQYFPVPGSTMSMADFVAAVAERCDVGLLLDLTHFLITMLNTGGDARKEIDRLPLERVVEIHVSGLSEQSGVVWDDHATPAPAAVFDLLGRVLERARPRAVTIEYNWSPSFPQSILASHVERVSRMVGRV
jgi:uncharacterized protein (UPF0276 family)